MRKNDSKIMLLSLCLVVMMVVPTLVVSDTDTPNFLDASADSSNQSKNNSRSLATSSASERSPDSNTWRVGASTDDCITSDVISPYGFSTTSAYVTAGTAYTLEGIQYYRSSGMRFTNINISQGAVISSAKLTFIASQMSGAETVNTKINGEAADNAITFSTEVDYNGRTRTNAYKDWNAIPGWWTTGGAYDSPDISNVIQEIVNRGGWSSGNALVIFWSNNGSTTGVLGEVDRLAKSYNADSTKAPQLIVTWIPPPPNPPTLVSPANNTWTNNTPLFDWDFGVESKGYNITLSANSDFSTIDYWVNKSTVTNATQHLWGSGGESASTIASGLWYWHVKANDTNGVWSDWSAWRIIKVSFMPTDTFYSSTSDGWASQIGRVEFGESYSTAHDAATASLGATTTTFTVGQSYTTDIMTIYTIWRSFVFFNTASIGSSSTITSATLSLYGTTDNSDTDFSITIQNGQPTYPHDPFTVNDYSYTYYSGDGGSFDTSSFTISAYNNISLNTTGLSWISKTGWTKLCIRSSRDINSNAPTGYEAITVSTAETANKPKLTVTYISEGNTPPSSPTLTAPANNTWSNTTPLFDWDFIDQNCSKGDASRGYNITLSANSDFTTINYWVNKSTPQASNISQHQWGTGGESSSTITDGTWYWRVKTKDIYNEWGDWSTGYKTIKVDGTAPSNPTTTESASPAVNMWSNDSTVEVSWLGAGDGSGSGVAGYYYCWSTSATTVPTTSDNYTTGTTNTSLALSDNASWYLHVRTKDNATNLGSDAYHIGPFKIDTTAPTANAGSDKIASQNATVTFDGSGSSDGAGSGIASYSWDFDSFDGIQVDATGVGPTHTYNRSGRHNVTLTVTDNVGYQSTDVMVVEVNRSLNLTIVGWNTVGWSSDNMSASTLWNRLKDAGASSVSVSRWNNSEGNWDGYLGPASTDFNLTYGVGYFIYVNVAVNVEIGNNSRFVRGTQTMSLISGWGTLGRAGCNATNASTLGNAIMSKPGVSSVCISKWNNTTNNWDGYIVGISPERYNFDIVYGCGYFIFVNTATEVEI